MKTPYFYHTPQMIVKLTRMLKRLEISPSLILNATTVIIPKGGMAALSAAFLRSQDQKDWEN